MPTNWEQVARQAARDAGFDEDVFAAQIRAESGFNPHARSGAGAQGIAQIMPATAKGWGVDPNDPRASLNAAARAMAKYTNSYGGNVRKALAAYNAGPGAVAKYGGVPPYAETQNYIKKIMGSAGSGTSSVAPQADYSPPASSGEAQAAAFVMKNSPLYDSVMSKYAGEDTVTSAAKQVDPGFSGPSSPNAQGVIRSAMSQVGRAADEAMQYIKAAGGTGSEPWCGDFVVWAFKKNGLKPPPARSVPNLLAWARQNGKLTKNPAAGNLVMFDWNGDGVPDHVGISRGMKNGRLNTVEGNPSGARSGSQVAAKTRDTGTILGYVNPYG